MDPRSLDRPRLDPRLAQRLVEKKAQLDRYRPLAPAVVQRLHDDLRVLLTYHSNVIEGNTLTLGETQLIIEHGLPVGGHPMREYLEATNHTEAFDHLATLVNDQEPISHETILTLWLNGPTGSMGLDRSTIHCCVRSLRIIASWPCIRLSMVTGAPLACC